MNSAAAVLRWLHTHVSGLNPPATEPDVQALERAMGCPLPDDVRQLYADHDGSNDRPTTSVGWCPLRLLPIREAIETNRELADALRDEPKAGDILWLCTDDNSNYAGVFLDGPLAGFVTVLNHEEPELTPAFRSIGSFVARAFRAGDQGAEREVVDIPGIDRELPTSAPAPGSEVADRALAQEFLVRYRAAVDDRSRLAWACSFLCVLPFPDTDLAVELLREPDMWIPERAVNLLELRRHAAPAELERLAREGAANGYGAAIRALVRLATPEARAALARLGADLTGQKRQTLAMWRGRRPLPPRW
jgi:hypothetical protein